MIAVRLTAMKIPVPHWLSHNQHIVCLNYTLLLDYFQFSCRNSRAAVIVFYIANSVEQYLDVFNKLDSEL